MAGAADDGRRVKRLLLVGGGHAHLEVVRQFASNPATAENVECVLASPDAKTVYSGMLPGVVAGHYRAAECQIDLADLARRAAWRFLPQSLQALEPGSRTVVFADGTRIAYDLLSLDTGSVADLAAIAGATDFVTPLRPFPDFLSQWNGMLTEAAAGNIKRIAVVGAGAGGVEIVLAMAYRLRTAGGEAATCKLALISDSDTILPAYASAVQKRFEGIFDKWGTERVCGAAVQKFEAKVLHTAGGRAIAADRVIWAAAGAAPAWPKISGLATDGRGFVAVDDHLRSLSHPEIFGGGDIVTLSGHPHPKSGVYAVRHGPVLAANLRAVLRGKPMRTYTPQRNNLSLLSAGDRYAVAWWNGWSVAGNWVWSWKNHIDRGFIAKYNGTDNGQMT
jgi:pyridine nucleotide-disulfide oxidoreductase family protein